MSFQIMISDAQREILLTALKQTQLQNYFGADAETRDEIDLLHSMLDDLRDDDSNYSVDPVDQKRKHILHGFCL